MVNRNWSVVENIGAILIETQWAEDYREQEIQTIVGLLRDLEKLPPL